MAKVVKLVLGKRPKHFVRPVSFPMLDGTTGTVEVEFIYRSRKEFAELVDTNQATIKAKADAEVARMKQVVSEGEAVSDFKQADLVAHQAEFNAAYLMQIVKGWNLDVPFSREAVDELVDEVPAAVNAINSAYREALLEGRLGN